MCYKKKKKPLPLDVTQFSTERQPPDHHQHQKKNKTASQLKRNSPPPIPVAVATSNNQIPPPFEGGCEKSGNGYIKIVQPVEELKGPLAGAAKPQEPKTDATQMVSDADAVPAPGAAVPACKVGVLLLKVTNPEPSLNSLFLNRDYLGRILRVGSKKRRRISNLDVRDSGESIRYIRTFSE